MSFNGNIDLNNLVTALGLVAGAITVARSQKATRDKVDDVHREVRNGVDRVKHVDEQLDAHDSNRDHETLREVLVEVKRSTDQLIRISEKIVEFQKYQETRNHDVQTQLTLINGQQKLLDRRLSEFFDALLQAQRPSPRDQTEDS